MWLIVLLTLSAQASQQLYWLGIFKALAHRSIRQSQQDALCSSTRLGGQPLVTIDREQPSGGAQEQRRVAGRARQIDCAEQIGDRLVAVAKPGKCPCPRAQPEHLILHSASHVALLDRAVRRAQRRFPVAPSQRKLSACLREAEAPEPTMRAGAHPDCLRHFIHELFGTPHLLPSCEVEQQIDAPLATD